MDAFAIPFALMAMLWIVYVLAFTTAGIDGGY